MARALIVDNDKPFRETLAESIRDFVMPYWKRVPRGGAAVMQARGIRLVVLLAFSHLCDKNLL